MSVTVTNPASNTSASAVTTLTLTSAVTSAGDNKIRLVAIQLLRSGSSISPGTVTVTYNSVAMTLVSSVDVTGAPYQRTLLFAINLGSTTPTANIVASWTNAANVIIQTAVVHDLLQQNAEVTATSNTTNGPTSITTLSANDVLVGVAGAGGGADLSGLDASETPFMAAALINSGLLTESQMGFSYREQAAAGPTSMVGWSSASTRESHVVAAFAPVVTAVTEGWGRDTWGSNAWGSDAASVTLTGLGATSALGSVTVRAGALVGATGLGAVGSVGTADAVGRANVALTGTTAQALLGAVSLVTNNNISVAGFEATASVGTVATSAASSVYVTGVQGNGAVGRVLVWGVINDGQTADWQPVNDSQTDTWVPVTDGNTVTWVEIP